MAPPQLVSTIMVMTCSKVSGISLSDFWGNGTVNENICMTQIEDSSCVIFGCNENRGDTYCLHLGHHCACTPGHCVNKSDGVGKCVPDPRVPADCHVDLHTSCVFSCSGDNTECDHVSRECTCSLGYCRDGNNECVASPTACQRGTPGTCAVFSCNADRGPTDCLSNVCFCQEGTCWNDQLQTCASPSEAAAFLAGTDEEVLASLATRKDYFYPIRIFGVRAKQFLRRYSAAGVLLFMAGLFAQIVVAMARRRDTTVSSQPLLAGA